MKTSEEYWQRIIFPAGATKQDWILDVALTIAMLLTTVSPYASYPYPESLVLCSICSFMVATLVLRRHAPLLMLAACTIAGTIQFLIVPVPMTSILVVPIMSYTIARWIPGRPARAVLVIGSIASILGPARWTFTFDTEIDILSLTNFTLFVMVCQGLILTPYAIGRRIRDAEENRNHQLKTAKERYRLLLAERDQQNRLAEAKARADIARELHDIVAHSLSVIIVQADGGKALAAKKPEAAAETLAIISETGREALAETRRILGVLRRDPDQKDEPSYQPAPLLSDIPELVAKTSPNIELITNGETPVVSSGLALTVYRIIQESLTNVLKHAGSQAKAKVEITYTDSHIEIEICDDGGDNSTPSISNGHGHGLRGMTERVMAMGGELEFGPHLPCGFRVFARLPKYSRKDISVSTSSKSYQPNISS